MEGFILENLSEYNLTLIVIDDNFHLYDLISSEIYEAMTLSCIKQLLDKWNKMGKCLHNYDIISITI